MAVSLRGVALFFCLMTSLIDVTLTALPGNWDKEVENSRAGVGKILDHILRGNGTHVTFNRLALLGDTFRSRMSGSQSLEDAINYAVDELKAEGFVNVNKESVRVPHWTRGRESAILHTPKYDHSMFILGLGTTEGTNGTDWTAEIIVVRSFDELDALNDDQVLGKIVVYNQPYHDYGQSGAYRRTGASRAAKKGAKAALVRSVTGRSIYSPHTGVQNYNLTMSPNKIPVASVTVEDAELMQRFQDRGIKLNVTLNMEAMNHDDTESFNVVAELRGTEKPDETVIFGGHFDTWDVTDGSMDDGGGVMIAWEAFSLIKQLDLKPKRTIRLVLWTAEEYGLIGGNEYYNAHKDQVNKTSLIMQADGGTFRPYGIQFTGSDLARSIMESILSPLNEINATTVLNGGGASSDTGLWVDAGVPGSELYNARENYFDFHHTYGDAMTALNADDLDRCTSVWATVAYSVANLDSLLPRHGDYVSGAVTHANSYTSLLISSLVAVVVSTFYIRG